MNILFVLGGLRLGGYEILTITLANELASRGHKVNIVSLSNDLTIKERMSPIIKFQSLPRKRKLDFNVLSKLNKLIRNTKPQIAVTSDYIEFIYIKFASLFGFRKTKFIVSFHSTCPDTHKDHRWNRIYGIMNKFLKNNHIAIHKSQISFYEKKYRLPRDSFSLVYNGIDTKYYQDGGKEYLRDGIIRLVHVASLKPLKDQLTLLKAMVELNKKTGNWSLSIAGQDVARVLPDLQKFIEENHIENKVKLLGRVGDVKRILQESDIFILTSKTEALPMSAIEANSMALPALLTDVGGNPEIVENGDNGYLFPVGDFQELAARIYYLYKNPDLIRKMGDNARKKAVEKFDFNTMVNNYLEVFSCNRSRGV